jgi:amino acid permease
MTEETEKEISNKINLDQGPVIKDQDSNEDSKKYLAIAIIVGVIIIALVVVATIFLIKPENSAMTEQLRDVFIIFMALTSLVLGIALVVLIIQLSVLINLLQNEIRPILDSTTETVNTLKGTTQFISNNITEPVIKLNQYLAMLKKLIKPSKR